MPAPLADHLNGKHGFLHQFDSGIYSSHVRLNKPDPAIFAVAQQRFGGNPATTLFIDDHPENIDAARRHGWQTHHCVDPDGLSAALRERRLIE
jgi:putative hydrolase of the HAD superfamily